MSKKAKIAREVWEKQDFENGTAKYIAARMVSQGYPADPQLVRDWARRLNRPLRVDQTGPRPTVNWHAVNWSMVDAQIAREQGVSPGWVRRMRKRYAHG